MKKTSLAATILLTGLTVLSSCNKINPDSPGGNDREDIPLTKSEEAVNSAVNDFAFKLYDALYQDEQILVSPLSLSLALSAATIGAQGETAAEMLQALGFGDCDAEAMNSYFNKMVSRLVKMDKKTTLEIANSIWADNTLEVKKDFVDKAVKYYSSEIKTVDMSSRNAVSDINKWCSGKTHGKITEIVKGLPEDMVMALINALYFKGKWSFDFDKDTESEDFTTISGSKTKVEMMKASEDLRYSEEKGYRLVELPYGNNSFVMDIILPDEKLDFSEAVKGLDAKTFHLLTSTGDTREVSLKMPEFKFEFSKELKEILPALGMKLPFDPILADFSGIADRDVNGRKLKLHINTVKHKTYIEVNTKGTEAAAVTFIGFAKDGCAGPEAHVDFIVDRPFIFAIREISTGAILFLGQKVN